MKSKQAQELLDKNSTWFADNEKTQSLWVRNYIAEKAIEIAEEGMKEKAIRVFCKTVCGGRDDSNSCKSCSLVKTFVDELNK